MSLRIGIDARRYSLAGRGQERYVRSLVGALAATGGENQFVLLGNGNARTLETLGTRVSFSPVSRRIRLQHRRRLAPLCRLLVRDLDVVHFPLADGWYGRVGRTVVTIHDLSVLRHPEIYFPDAAAEREARRHFGSVTSSADAVIAVSEATRRDVVGLLGVPEEGVVVVPHGVEPRFRPPADAETASRLRETYRLPDRYLLFVGGVDFKKNVARLVEGYALACLMGRVPHALVLAGPQQHEGNPFFDQARDRAAVTGVAEKFVWLGYVPDADLPALYSSADALVCVSLMEGFGLPVLEAMACGTPVVTSSSSAMSEIAGEAAVLVDPHDPEAIADGILSVLDTETGRWLAEAGRGRAAAYTWERAAARTLSVYEAAAAGRPPAETVQT